MENSSAVMQTPVSGVPEGAMNEISSIDSTIEPDSFMGADIEDNSMPEESTEGLFITSSDESPLQSEEELLVETRDELEEIKNEPFEPEPEEDDGYDEQIATLDETIRLLEVQRDALKEQLGEGLVKFFAKLVDYFFAETLMDKPSLIDDTAMQPSEAWREDTRFQLRKIESKIADLKQIRNNLVANK